MNQHSRAFVGIDTSKLRNAVAVAEDGRGGDVRYLGEIDTTEAATRKLVAKLAAKYRQLNARESGVTFNRELPSEACSLANQKVGAGAAAREL